MDLVQGKLSVTNGLIGNANAFPMLKHWNASPLSCVACALFSVVDTCSSPSCIAVPEYRCQEIAPSTQHAPGRIVERPLPRDSS